MASVSIRKVKKNFDQVEVLHDVSLEVEDGTFFVIVGPSGCGKSTLLRIIAGLEDLTSGEIWIDDKMVNDLPPRDRDIAMVFQSYALYPHMTVAKNMAFSLRMRRLPKSEIRDRVNSSAEILDLQPYLERYPRELSGGQRQRVAIGRAIVRDPKVFLFDEPLSNLDAKLRLQMRVEILNLRAHLGATMLYVTHDQIEAMTMADKIVVMNEGHIEQIGAPLELYDNPVNTFVAGFLGSPSMNFLKGRVRKDAVSGVDVGSGFSLPLKSKADELAGRDVIYGVRPEDFDRGANGVPALVKTVEATGAATHIIARIADQEFVCVFADRFDVRPGDYIRLTPNVDSVHLFDSETGNRI